MFPLLTILEIDASVITGLKTYISTMFGDLGLIIALVIGLPLAFWVIRRVIGLVRAR